MRGKGYHETRAMQQGKSPLANNDLVGLSIGWFFEKKEKSLL